MSQPYWVELGNKITQCHNFYLFINPCHQKICKIRYKTCCCDGWLFWNLSLYQWKIYFLKISLEDFLTDNSIWCIVGVKEWSKSKRSGEWVSKKETDCANCSVLIYWSVTILPVWWRKIIHYFIKCCDYFNDIPAPPAILCRILHPTIWSGISLILVVLCHCDRPGPAQ